jgi:NifB/MoaA-like Fe-S oxidoreductase
MRKLIDGGIRLHTQIVLMPDINDGIHLEESVRRLYAYYPGVSSVAIVPLGLSDHGTPRDIYTPVSPPYCREIIRQVKPWQEQFRSEIGSTFAYLADEFYLQGGISLPETRHYDEFAQIEDGVGMVRKFLDDFEPELARRRKRRPRLRGTLATGRLFYPHLKDCAERFNDRLGSCLSVCEVENRFMGANITVAGLLGGADIIAALRGADPGDFVIIPNEAISRLDGVMVDNLTPAEVSAALGRPVHPSGRTMKDFFSLLCNQL